MALKAGLNVDIPSYRGGSSGSSQMLRISDGFEHSAAPMEPL